MRPINTRHCAIVAGALAATALTGAATAAAQVQPPREEIITDAPPPPVQGPPGPTRGLACGIDGPALDLGEGSLYPSARRPLRTAMIFVDFSDNPAGPESVPQDFVNDLVPDAQRILRSLSYGKFRLDVTPHLQWVRMPKPLASYGFADETTKWDHYHEYIADALHAAEPSADLSKFKAVFVVAAPNSVAPAAAHNLPPGGGIKVDGTRVEHAVTLEAGIDRAPTVVHETGHILGLPDLYEVGVDVDWFRFVGPWDLMSDIYQGSLPMLSWTRRMVGWLGDRNFRCLRHLKRTVRLFSVEGSGRIKGAVIRIGRRRAYVVESRAELLGEGCPGQGVLIYRWNGNRGTGHGPIRVLDAQPGDGTCGPHTNALFKPGEAGTSKYVDRNVAVTVLRSGEKAFRVRIKHRRR